ncbi:MAG: hypothetical protein ACRD1T_19390 [Acidimicrobiia bacterium]
MVHYLAPDGYSSQICRFGQPGPATAPTGASVTAGSNNYTAIVNWTQNDTAHTHEFLYVQKSGSNSLYIARYYLPYTGTGTKSKSITLGVYDQLEFQGTYYFYIATCNAKYNAWSSPSTPCNTTFAGTRTLGP